MLRVHQINNNKKLNDTNVSAINNVSLGKSPMQFNNKWEAFRKRRKVQEGDLNS